MVEQVADKKVNVVEVEPVVGDAHFGGIANCDKAKKISIGKLKLVYTMVWLLHMIIC